MKILSKIAVFVGLVAFMSSCQKEEMPSPQGGCSSHQESAASNQRTVDPGANKPTSVGGPAISGKEEGRVDEIVGGGDDDRNGGDGKKEKKR